jgi:hypothetical protein
VSGRLRSRACTSLAAGSSARAPRARPGRASVARHLPGARRPGFIQRGCSPRAVSWRGGRRCGRSSGGKPRQKPRRPTRARGENQGTRKPTTPQPLRRGSPIQSVTIVEDYLTDSGRKRQRSVVIELDAIRAQLRQPSDADLADSERIRRELRLLAGESTFEIWLAQLELAATDPGGSLLLATPAATRSWVAARFARAFDRAGRVADRSLRLADDRELRLLDALAASPSPAFALGADALPKFAPSNPSQGGHMTISVPVHHDVCKDEQVDRRVDVQIAVRKATGKDSGGLPTRGVRARPGRCWRWSRR